MQKRAIPMNFGYEITHAEHHEHSVGADLQVAQNQ
jgi:hypothetical protein